jgi:hypothetical protein
MDEMAGSGGSSNFAPGRFPVQDGDIDSEVGIGGQIGPHQFLHVLLLLSGGRHDPDI